MYAYRAYGREAHFGQLLAEKTTGNVYTYQDYTPGTGIGWEYDLLDDFYQNGKQYLVYNHKGWGRIKIGKFSNKSGVSESSSAVGSYFHKEGTVTGSLTFAPVPSIGISNAWNYDKANDSGRTFSWTNDTY